jgi:hypothetical protein
MGITEWIHRVDQANVLIKDCASITVAAREGRKPLHLTSQNGHIEVGCTVNVVSITATPVH